MFHLSFPFRLFREIYRSIPILSFSLDSFPIEMYRSCSWINENAQKLYLPLPFYESLPFCVWHRHSLWQHPLIQNLIWKPYFDPDIFGMPCLTASTDFDNQSDLCSFELRAINKTKEPSYLPRDEMPWLNLLEPLVRVVWLSPTDSS